MWISNIQKAIDYIESHLEEDINVSDVAKEAYSSEFHFQKVFGILCGYTVMDYIRCRRLANAAIDLLDSNNKIIDIAYKYGYDTPESFTRAFKKFHGVLPSDVKHGANFKTFSKLTVKLSLVGGIKMEYRIEKLPAIKVMCKRKVVKKPEDTSPKEIIAFWEECKNNGTTKKLISKYNTNSYLKGLLGISFSNELNSMKFPYGIGIESDEYMDGFDSIEIPAYTYAVFRCIGPMPDAFANTYKKICEEFFPQNDRYEYGYGVEFEVYPSEDVSNKNYTCEIWIAVKEK